MTVSTRRIAELLPKRITPRFALALSALTLVFAAPVAHAQVVFDNGTPNTGGGFISDPGLPQFEADTFTFAAPSTTFDTVQWWGYYSPANTPPATDNFTLSFYNTTSGTPNAASLATFTLGNVVNRVPTGGTVGGNFLFRYTASLSSPVTFTAGTYGLGIVNDTANDPNDNWVWATTNFQGSHFFRTNPFGAYLTSSSTTDLAFNLQNNRVAPPAVPEPSEYAVGGMLVSSLLFGMVRGRRRKSSKNDIDRCPSMTA